MDNKGEVTRKVVASGDVTVCGYKNMPIQDLYHFFLKQAEINCEAKDLKLLSDISITLDFDIKNQKIKVTTKADVCSIVPGDNSTYMNDELH